MNAQIMHKICKERLKVGLFAEHLQYIFDVDVLISGQLASSWTHRAWDKLDTQLDLSFLLNV